MSSRSGEAIILLALVIMALGKIAYGTWLTGVSSPFYVMVVYGAMLAGFLPAGGHQRVLAAPWLLVVLNVGTALCFLLLFLALKQVEPAAAGAIQSALAPVLALLIALLWRGERPGRKKVLVSGGLLAGCVILSVGVLRGNGMAHFSGSAAPALLALAGSALGSALITLSSKELSRRGWSAWAIMAHRSYLIVPVAALLVVAPGAEALPGLQALPLVLGIGMLTSILPMLLLQIGIERCEPHKVLVLMSVLPLFIYLLEGLSPSYVWTLNTACGIAVIFACVLIDSIRFSRKSSSKLE